MFATVFNSREKSFANTPFNSQFEANINDEDYSLGFICRNFIPITITDISYSFL